MRPEPAQRLLTPSSPTIRLREGDPLLSNPTALGNFWAFSTLGRHRKNGVMEDTLAVQLPFLKVIAMRFCRECAEVGIGPDDLAQETILRADQRTGTGCQGAKATGSAKNSLCGATGKDFRKRIRRLLERTQFNVSVILADHLRIVPDKFLNDGRGDAGVLHQARRGMAKGVKS